METALDNGNRTVLVLGATGQQGGSVVTALMASSWRVRALVRDPVSVKARALAAAGAETVQSDLGDATSLRAALAGAYGVFSVQPSSGQGAVYGVTDEDEVRFGTTVATLAVEAGVGHFVYSSANAAGPGKSGMGHFDSKGTIEDHVRSLDMRSTILRPSAFMEILLLPGLLDEGRLTFFMRPDQSMQFIAAADIGRVAAGVLADPERLAGRTIEIAGDTLTGNAVAEKMSHAAGRPITYGRFPDDLLERDPFLGRLAGLVDEGRLAGRADVASLRQEFPGLLSMDMWLAGSGKGALVAALETTGEVALR